MTQRLPQSVAAYFAAQSGQDISPLFTPDAVVHDEGRERHGREAIRDWKAETDRQYQPVTRVVSVRTESPDKMIVTGSVSGSFPNSPIELDYTFALEGDLIARLSIA